MKKTLFLLSAALILCFDSAFGWGKMGHDAIAYIAECHLTPKAKKTIEKYIGTSIVHYASWMDAYRFEPQYAHTSLWHTAWVDDNDEYDPTRKPDGNAIKGIEDTMELLRDYKSLDDSTVVVSIKYLVHLVGDMHCPTHVKYPDVKGFNIYVDGRKLNYHGVWDSYVLDCNVRWSGMEFQHILDRCTKREIKAITAGSVRDWFHDCAVYCRQIYVLAQPDQQFKSPDVWEDFLNPALPIAERQILVCRLPAGARAQRTVRITPHPHEHKNGDPKRIAVFDKYRPPYFFSAGVSFSAGTTAFTESVAGASPTAAGSAAGSGSAFVPLKTSAFFPSSKSVSTSPSISYLSASSSSFAKRLSKSMFGQAIIVLASRSMSSPFPSSSS